MKALKASLQEIQDNSDIDVPRLMTAALGLSSEGGEFVEIV
ncbi:MAG TPA: pyrophosphatase, partial [Gammaproteobacteria bacterium]|nr:pyrophosphatase [Gammaproteobacteria bacterium]